MEVSHDNLAAGLYIFSVGLFKKIIIADTMGKAVSWGWGNIDILSSLEIIIVMLSYTFQIYFDFSGYCDMAIGIAKMFNIELPVNFNSPYKSYSVIEFWERWHITLNRFLRTYIYFPLGGSRKGKIRACINVIIVFLVSGIWHGANWTFILWGGVHGLANVANRIFAKAWNKSNKIFQWLCTFVFINVTWLIFRAENVKQAFYLLQKAFRFDSCTFNYHLARCFRLTEIDTLTMWLGINFDLSMIMMLIFLSGALCVCLKFSNLNELEFKPTLSKAFLTAVLLVWCVMSFSGVSSFLYFNF